MYKSYQELVKDVSGLVALPEVSMRVNQLADNPDSTVEQMGKIIAQDPALAVQLLKMANSPFYGLSREVETISRAVTVLGTNQIRDMVLSAAASHAFDGLPNELISVRDFWHHSLFCGILAKILTRESTKLDGDTIFIAGLLHDVGQLIMFNRMPEASHEAILLAMDGMEDHDLEMHEAERRIFGFDHSQVGAELIKNWHLSPMLQETIACHHEPGNAKQYPVEAALVHIANAVAVMAEFDSTNEDEIELPHIEESSWQVTGLSRDVLPKLMREAQDEIKEIESIFFP